MSKNVDKNKDLWIYIIQCLKDKNKSKMTVMATIVNYRLDKKTSKTKVHSFRESEW